MTSDKKIKIAVISEDQNFQDYATLMLIGENYEVLPYFQQNEALRNLTQDAPDLIISDFQSTQANGLDICKKIKSLSSLSHTPLIFVLEGPSQLDKAKLIYAGADDYTQKSLLEEELLLRVKLNLFRSARAQDINPVSLMPGETALIKQLQRRIDAKSPCAVCGADLYKFREFNQRYGFKKGDEVIRYAATLLSESLRYAGGPADFLAHAGSDNFFFISSPLDAQAVVDKAINDFDKGIGGFYDEPDRKKGFIVVKSRKGDIAQVPLMRLHIGVVTNEHYPFTNPAQILQVANELKDFAQKSFEKSMYVKERRKDCHFS
jgi:PleD family two-component response regulator